MTLTLLFLILHLIQIGYSLSKLSEMFIALQSPIKQLPPSVAAVYYFANNSLVCYKFLTNLSS